MLTRRTLLQLLGIATAATAVPPIAVSAAPAPSPDSAPVLPPAHITKLELFLRSRGIKPAQLARESGYARQHLLRVRMGRIEPDTRCIGAIVVAVRRLSGEDIRASDLFGPASIGAGKVRNAPCDACCE
jgi:hypothetical protein